MLDTAPGLPESADPAPGFSSAVAKRAARNATALALSAVAAKGLTFVWQLVLARWLGSEGYGIYGTIGALLAVGAAIPEFGMGMIVVRDVAQRPAEASRYLGATLSMQPLLAGAGYAVLMLARSFTTRLRALLAQPRSTCWSTCWGTCTTSFWPPSAWSSRRSSARRTSSSW